MYPNSNNPKSRAGSVSYTDRPGFHSWLCNLVWACSLNPQGLHILICKLDNTTSFTGLLWGFNQLGYSTYILTHSRHSINGSYYCRYVHVNICWVLIETWDHRHKGHFWYVSQRWLLAVFLFPELRICRSTAVAPRERMASSGHVL